MSQLDGAVKAKNVRSLSFTTVKNKLTKDETKQLHKLVSVLTKKPLERGGKAAFNRSMKKTMKSLGHGSYAVVFELSEDKVVRVEHCSESHKDYYESQSPYSNWITKLVLKTRNKHVPKVFMHGELEFEKEHKDYKYWITVLERLEGTELSYIDSDIVESLVTEGRVNSLFFKKSVDLKNYKFNRKSLSNIGKMAEKHDLYLDDIAGSNIMYRAKDKRIVITDPCCEI